MSWTAVRLPDSFAKFDVSANVAELWNHCELLILGSWGPLGNRGGKGQVFIITIIRSGNNISHHLLSTHYGLGVVIHSHTMR